MDVLHLRCHFADFFKYNVLILFRLGDLDDWLVVSLLKDVWLNSVGFCGLNEGEEEYPIFQQPQLLTHC
jgi:hypothetical protein